METIIRLFSSLVETMDHHEGMVAMVGIAVTVWIFIREVSNNYFTMEQDNFKDIFKNLVLKDLPKKIDNIELATEDEWNLKFEELIDVLDEILVNSRYYKYSIPFFYEYLRLRVDEIRDLERHENWRLYRNSVRQNALIQKKCQSIIKSVNNASKGKVFLIKLYQRNIVQTIRHFFVKNVIDRPADRITEMYIKSEIATNFVIMNKKGKKIDASILKKLTFPELEIKEVDEKIHVIDVRAIENPEMCLGYIGNIRWGRRIGEICVKAKNDRHVQIINNANHILIKWNDNSIHKIVMMWKMEGDKEHIFFSKFNVRSCT